MTNQIKINADLLGRGTVLIDGHDIGDQIHGLQVEIQVGEVTQVALLVHQPLEFEGEVEIVQVQMGLSAQHLDELPVEAIQEKAEALPWGNSGELVANVITVLKEMIQDAPQPGYG